MPILICLTHKNKHSIIPSTIPSLSFPRQCLRQRHSKWSQRESSRMCVSGVQVNGSSLVLGWVPAAHICDSNFLDIFRSDRYTAHWVDLEMKAGCSPHLHLPPDPPACSELCPFMLLGDQPAFWSTDDKG